MKSNIKSNILLFIFCLCFGSCDQIQHAEAQNNENTAKGRPPQLIEKTVITSQDTIKLTFCNGDILFQEDWDTLAHPRFWKQIMCLSPDSCIINVASTRLPIQTACFRTWSSQSEYEKTTFKSRVREENCVDYGEELFVTSGKREFYEHRKSVLTIGRAVEYFREYGTDPWYAQTILLIESPGKHQGRSYAGAGGPFQLMRSVAIQFGLKVNKYVDERNQLNRAAYGASRLLSKICIPKVKAMLDSRGIQYSEEDTWFRLLVLHAYHAGAGNLAAAINKINPDKGGMWLITTLWKTEAGGFKNESQNYSQIALAALMNFQEIIQLDGDTVFTVWGDKALGDAKRLSVQKGSCDAEAYQLALLMYEKDLGEGTIDYAYYENRLAEIKRTGGNSITYPSDDMQLVRVGQRLLYKRQTSDAIQILRYNLDCFPSSSLAAEALSKAYSRSGNAGMAQKYMSKSAELNNARQ